jgi:hypothetical protein
MNTFIHSYTALHSSSSGFDLPRLGACEAERARENCARSLRVDAIPKAAHQHAHMHVLMAGHLTLKEGVMLCG